MLPGGRQFTYETGLSREERAYLRAKAVWLAMVLDPPARVGRRVNHTMVQDAFMDYQNALDALRG